MISRLKITLFRLGKISLFLIVIYPFNLSSATIVHITPSWQIYIHPASEKELIYNSYKLFFQQHIIEFLDSMQIKAIPAAYTSAMSFSYNPKNIEELNYILQDEPKEQRSYFTIIPVITNTNITNTGMNYRICLSFSLFLQDSSGKLGKEIINCKIVCNGSHEKNKTANENSSAQTQSIRKAIFSNTQWTSLINFIRTFPNIYDSSSTLRSRLFSKEQQVCYFSQSDIIYHDDLPTSPQLTSFHVHKANVLVLDATNMNKLAFDFDLSKEFPVVDYAYIVKPDYKTITLTSDNIHIEQSPDALPNDKYSGERYLVINLPGLISNSIVCYTITYYDRSFFDTLYYHNVVRSGKKYPLAQDIILNRTDDSTMWQVRIIIPNTSKQFYKRVMPQSLYSHIERSKNYLLAKSDEYYQQIKSPSLRKESETYGFGFFYKVFLFEGFPPSQPQSLYEPLSYMDPPIVRIASTTSLDSLYSDIRDTIFSMLRKNTCPLVLPEYLSRQNDAEYSINNLQRYISDSLRYIHTSFGVHSAIPFPAESTLSSRMGDCKDLSFFLISQLKLIGIEAFPALVNTKWQSTTNIILPSYDANNHMVVYVPNKNWWIDPVYYPLPPSITPEYLTGLESVVMYPDSIVRIKITDNEDSTYRFAIKYEIKMKDENISVKYSETSSYEKTTLLMSILSKIDSSKYLDVLFPSEMYYKRYSPKEISLTINRPVHENERLSITRSFTVNNAITKSVFHSLLYLPETPFASYVNLVSSNKRYTDIFFPTNLMGDITIIILGKHDITWPDKGVFLQCKEFLTIIGEFDNETTFRFNIKKGIIPLNKYEKLKSAFEGYRNFFSSPITIQ